MKKLKGPELKMPPFVADLFYDLRDRRLLPLIAVLAVAIVAVPFLLSNSTKPPPSSAELGAVLAQQASSGTARLTVVTANPGLRDYRKRLSDLRAKDPFEQHFTAPVLNKGSAPTSRTSTSSTTTTTSTSTGSTSPSPTSTSPTSTSPSSTSPASGGHPTKPHLIYFTFAIDVKISRSDGGNAATPGMSQPTTRQRVMPTTPLPGEKTPVVTYMGLGSKAKTALLLVSTDVKSVFGDGKCLSGTGTCQLLEVEPGFPETFIYGPNDVRYKINVLKIEPVVSRVAP